MLAGKPFGANWLAWIAGHALGTMIMTPAVMLGLRGEAIGWLRRATWQLQAEALVLLALVVASARWCSGRKGCRCCSCRCCR